MNIREGQRWKFSSSLWLCCKVSHQETQNVPAGGLLLAITTEQDGQGWWSLCLWHPAWDGKAPHPHGCSRLYLMHFFPPSPKSQPQAPCMGPGFCQAQLEGPSPTSASIPSQLPTSMTESSGVKGRAMGFATPSSPPPTSSQKTMWAEWPWRTSLRMAPSW